MKCMVLGAGGQIGAALTHHLVNEGHRPLAVYRAGKPRQALADLDIERIELDLREADFNALLKNIDVVFDASAPYPLALDTSLEEISESLSRYRRMIDAVERQKVRLGYVSSFITLPRQTGMAHSLVSETHPYYIVKQQLERLVLSKAERYPGIKIFCPSAFIGPWDQRADEHCLIPRILRGDIPIAAEQRLDVIDVRDIAAYMATEMFNQDRAQTRFPLHGQQVQVSEFLRTLQTVTGCRVPRAFPAPGAIASLGASALEALLKTLGKPLSVPSLPIVLMFESYRYEGVSCQKTSLTKSIADAVEWYAKRGSKAL